MAQNGARFADLTAAGPLPFYTGFPFQAVPRCSAGPATVARGTLGAARGPVNAAGQTHLTPAFKASYLPGLSVKTGLFDVGGVIRRFLPLMYLSTALLLMPVRLARLANGHGPLGRLPVGFRAKSAIFLASAQKSYFLGFSRHQPSACASLRRSKGGFASFCPFSDLLGDKDFLDASALLCPHGSGDSGTGVM